jgi:uncharacterized RDD family membrane protein YckC
MSRMPSAPSGAERREHTVYAGFWWRALAAVLDWIVLTVIDGIVAFAVGMDAMLHEGFSAQGPIASYTFVIDLLYFPLMESSRLRASLGKLACGLMVVDEDGRQIGFARAFGRNMGKFLSALILFVGFMMAGWTHRKQALHDMMAGCLVLKKYSPTVRVQLPET